MRGIIVLITALMISPNAMAAVVDLSGWIPEEVPGGIAANWVVQNAPANDAVLQINNSRPSIFFDPTNTTAQGTVLSGKIQVQTSGDDDYIGFVLGYNSGDAGSTSTNFILIDWKQGNQAAGGCFGTGAAGLAISRVAAAGNECSFWGHDSGLVAGTSEVYEIARADTLGSTGWVDNQIYDFDLVFQSNFIDVFVDSVLEISISAADAGLASFQDGSFGFYNYSQSTVLYSAITEDVAPPGPTPQGVPEPAPLAFFAFALLAIGVRSRRR